MGAQFLNQDNLSWSRQLWELNLKCDWDHCPNDTVPIDKKFDFVLFAWSSGID